MGVKLTIIKFLKIILTSSCNNKNIYKFEFEIFLSKVQCETKI